MADDKIEIEIVLDDKSIKSGFNNIRNLADAAGKSIGSSFDGAALKNFGVQIAKIAAGAGAAALAISAIVVKKSIDAASEYEDVVNKFNTALSLSGQYSKEASAGFLEFANSIQKTTKFSDDQVVSSGALIQNIARLSSDGLQRATKASLDLSSALGIDLETASQLVAKSANGNVTAFNRYGIEIRKGATDTETFSNTLKTLEERFGGAAAASAGSFSGSLSKLRNSFDDIFKEIGRAITKSPALTEMINFISKQFSNIADFIKTSIGDKDIFKDLLINFSVIVQASLETARQIGGGFELAFLRAQQAWLAFKVLTTLGLSDKFNQQLVDINNQIALVKTNLSFDSEATTGIDAFIGKLSETNGKLKELTDSNIANMESVKDAVNPVTFSEGLSLIGDQFDILKNRTALSVADFKTKNEELKKVFTDVGTTARNQLANGIGGAFAKVGEAFVTGKNALKEFAKAFIGTIGQMAVQAGSRFILEGIAWMTVPGSQGVGGSMIAAGAALATFGGALSAFAGGGGASAQTGGGAQASSTGGGASISPTAGAAQAIEKKETSVKIDVAGTVLDPISVGKQIAQILNDTFDATGTKVVTA
jgi:hypothetical protein